MEMSRDAGSIPAASINKPLAKSLQVAYFIGIAFIVGATRKSAMSRRFQEKSHNYKVFCPFDSGILSLRRYRICLIPLPNHHSPHPWCSHGKRSRKAEKPSNRNELRQGNGALVC